MNKIVVLGSNFAGLDVVRILRRNKNVELVVIDKNPQFQFYPGIHQIISKRKIPFLLNIDLVELYQKKNIQFYNEEVLYIDSKKKEVKTINQILKYDYLVNCMGSTVEFYNIPGAKEYSFTFKSLEDAILLKKNLLKINQERKKYNIVVAGSGFTGIELTFEILRLIKKIGKGKEINLFLIEGENKISPFANEKSEKYIQDLLEKNRVILRTNFLIKEVKKNQIINSNFETLNYDILIWCAGLGVTNAIKNSDIKFDRFGLIVNDYFESVSSSEIYSCGDGMSKTFDGGEVVPKTAQYAEMEAKIVAKNIINKINNKPPVKYNISKNFPILIDLGKNGACLAYKNYLFKHPSRFFHYLKYLVNKRYVLSRINL